jgi:hypothetical protein
MPAAPALSVPLEPALPLVPPLPLDPPLLALPLEPPLPALARADESLFEQPHKR